MLKSCKYCGKIHDSKFECTQKPKRKKKYTQQNGFRSTYTWQCKRKEIQERDNYLCQVCIRGRHGDKRYVYNNTSVHHIVPLNEDFSKRLDDANLILLCDTHHEQAEQGIIGRSELTRIVFEQNNPPGG